MGNLSLTILTPTDMNVHVTDQTAAEHYPFLHDTLGHA